MQYDKEKQQKNLHVSSWSPVFCVVAYITTEKNLMNIKITADFFSANQPKLQYNEPWASWKNNWDLSFRKKKPDA